MSSLFQHFEFKRRTFSIKTIRQKIERKFAKNIEKRIEQKEQIEFQENRVRLSRRFEGERRYHLLTIGRLFSSNIKRTLNKKKDFE